jgi:hypothetical protein
VAEPRGLTEGEACWQRARWCGVVGKGMSMDEKLEGVGEVEAYCQNPDCPVREVTVEVKLYRGDEALTPATKWHCPCCRKRLAEVRYLTAEEADAQHEREARISVNMQRRERDYRRQHPEEEWMLWDAADLVDVDDSLPE